MAYTPSKIISGGQTGVDRGALDAAGIAGIDRGGWCPRGRRAEDGVIPDSYPVVELPTDSYEARTERNVLASDATLIVCRGPVSAGTAYTVEMARKHDRPFLIVNPDDGASTEHAKKWMSRIGPCVLNVAGPRESDDAGIQACARNWLLNVLSS